MPKVTKKELKRESLLNQGVTMLMGQGYHGTGLQEILNAANIPKGSFYNYFGSKENFGAEVIQHYIDPFITQLAAHLQQSETDALSAIRRYFGELIVELEKNEFKGGCLLGNLMGEIGDSSEICRKSLQFAVGRYRDLLQSGLAKAQQQGTVRSDKTTEEMADLLINTWQGALLRMKIEKSSVPAKQCCKNLLEDFFKP
ncbi:TetR family transcriptional regulator C-terminal domain-containing protein [Nitrosomonas communis]|uniref:TetR family transcriptional regulator C-terminal domain-containing protein n=1 Tax=Nitrosomonas communis TaxID=44574 RepID=UPI0026EF3D85|nr:TetR family transcriptional regulator C-terminal domain-containing protein [Nitrosomonas communis]MCO6429120.1 TetR family transcriptional regulator C-terminal domain-containing protein [Nitrosomonas communis]